MVGEVKYNLTLILLTKLLPFLLSFHPSSVLLLLLLLLLLLRAVLIGLMMETSKQARTDQDEMVVVGVLLADEDLISEILLRLPPVSVVILKSVCKSWYSLISNPCFLRNHARQFHLIKPSASSGLLLSPNSTFPACEKHSVYAILPQDQDHQDETTPPPNMLKLFLDHSLPSFKQKFSDDCYLIDSCNGLLLYHTESGSPNKYTVFNPITNQYKEVPLMDLLHTFIKPNELEQTLVFDHPHIVFDPSKSSSYKLLAVLHGPPYTHFELYVYSSDTGSWRLLTSFTNKYITGRNTFMFDGVFYWLSISDSICFDVVNETVSLLPMPPTPVEYPNSEVFYFGECGGRLRFIEEYSDYFGSEGRTFPCSFDIMEMDQGSKIWTVKSRVILEAGYDHLIQETTSDDDPFYQSVVKVMHLYETVKGEEAVLLNVDYKRIVSFNITTNTFGKELTIPYFEDLDCLNAFPFTPTLYPLLT